MNNPVGFIVDLLRQPAWIPAWVSWLAAVNLFSVHYWEEPLARLILGTFLVSVILMMALYARFGFEKILGLGHVLWIALLPYALVSIPGTEGGFRAYLVTLSASIAVSLAFDFFDACTYFAARRAAAKKQ